MHSKALLVLALAYLWMAAAVGMADTPPARTVNSQTYDGAGTGSITSTLEGGKRGLDCHVSNVVGAPASTQTIVSGVAIDPRQIRALTTADQVACQQLGTWNIGTVSTIPLPPNAAQETGGNLAAIASSASAINGKTASFDLDTGGGTQNVQGVNLRKAASGGSVELGTATDPLRTDPTGSTTQPVSAASLPLPAGAATSANQTTGLASLASIDGKIANTIGGAIKTDGSAFTQPISAAALPLPAGAATAGNQTTSNASLASIDSKLFQNAGGTASKVDGSSFTQPVSGSVSATQGTSPWTVSGTLAATQSGTWNVNNVSGTVSLPTGAATSANQTTQITSLQLLDDVPAGMNDAFSKGSPAMGQLDDSGTTAATENSVAPVRITGQRAMHINLRNASGSEIGTTSNPVQTAVGATLTSGYLSNGYMFSAAATYTCATAGADNPALYFRNPTGSGKNFFIHSIKSNVVVTNVAVEYKIFLSPTVSANGTAVNAYQRYVGNGTTASGLPTTGPTITTNGNLVVYAANAQNGPQIDLAKDYEIGMQPNTSLLMTCNPASNNRAIDFTIVWSEVP